MQGKPVSIATLFITFWASVPEFIFRSTYTRLRALVEFLYVFHLYCWFFFVLSVRCWFFLSYQCANLISAPSVKRPPTNKRPPPPPITLLAEIKWPPGRLFEEIRNSLFPNKGEGGRTPASAKCHITPALSHVVKRQFCRLVLRIYLTNSKHGHCLKNIGQAEEFWLW